MRRIHYKFDMSNSHRFPAAAIGPANPGMVPAVATRSLVVLVVLVALFLLAIIIGHGAGVT